MEHKLKQFVDIYRGLLRHPEFASACISNSSTDKKIKLQTRWTQHDLERKEKISFNRDYLVKYEKEIGSFAAEFCSSNTEIKNELWNKESTSGSFRAIVRKTKEKEEDKYFIEIWDKLNKRKTINVESKKKHGKVYENDDLFGSFAWSPSQKKILYVAEKKLPKPVSFFEEKAEDQTSGNEHFFKDTWGEQITDKYKSVLCIVDVDSEDIEVIEEIPEDIFPGQPCWSPSGENIIFVGWNSVPYKLGAIYCPIRDCSLYKYNLQSKALEKLSEEGRSVRSARFSPDGTKLIYVDSDVGGPHMQGSRLMMLNWDDAKISSPSVVIDIVKKAELSEFPGLNILSLPQRCWISDSRRIIISSVWRSDVALLEVDVIGKTVKRLTPVNKSCSCIDVYNDLAVLCCSSPNTPHYLCLTNVSETPGSGSYIRLHPLDGEPVVKSHIDWEVIQQTPTPDRAHPQFGIHDYEVCLVMPKSTSDKKPPLIVFPHGGPHSVFATTYMMYVVGFCEASFAVLLVNYRGSFGFCDDSLRSLPGYVGDSDVKDCQAAAEYVIKTGKVDSSRVAVFGGSHGGFLTTHLIGQYPDFYKAATCRNPVTNLTNMVGVTDIPDWSYVEAGVEFDHTGIPDSELLSKMLQCSPVHYIDKVKTPLQIMLGMDDRRVPPKQGEQFYKALLFRNVPARLVCYQGNSHPIIKPESQADAFVNVLEWYTTHMDL